MMAGLLLLSAVFAAGATVLALASAAAAASHRDKLLAWERAGDPRALRLDRMLADRDRLFAGLRLARVLARIASAACLGAALAPTGFAGVVAAIVLGGIALTLLDALARAHGAAAAESMALRLEPVIVATGAVAHPLERLIERTAGLALRRAGYAPQIAANAAAIEDVSPSSNGDRGETTADRIDELVVSDVMVHRTEMQVADAALPVPELVRMKLDSRYARLPVFQGSPDNIIGVIESVRVVRALGPVAGDATRLTLSDILTPAWFVPDTTPVRDQLRAFLKRRTEIALVVDEYGDVMGLVTLSDIVEEIVGDITHMTILDVPGVRAQPDGSFLIDGQVPIRDLNRALDWELPDEETTTIAGLVIYEARTIPAAGQVFTFYGFTFQVLRRERNRVTRLRVTPTKIARRRG